MMRRTEYKGILANRIRSERHFTHRSFAIGRRDGQTDDGMTDQRASEGGRGATEQPANCGENVIDSFSLSFPSLALVP